jgi:hypothetical protein
VDPAKQLQHKQRAEQRRQERAQRDADWRNSIAAFFQQRRAEPAWAALHQQHQTMVRAPAAAAAPPEATMTEQTPTAAPAAAPSTRHDSSLSKCGGDIDSDDDLRYQGEGSSSAGHSDGEAEANSADESSDAHAPPALPAGAADTVRICCC